MIEVTVSLYIVVRIFIDWVVALVYATSTSSDSSLTLKYQ